MRLKLAGALMAALLVFGMVFGVGQAAAASLPGGPLYGLKLTAEEARMGLTSDPEAKAELAAELAENRLDEIGKMMAAGRTVDGATAHKAQQQLSQAYQYMHQVNGEQQLQARHRLSDVIENQHRFMALEVNSMAQQQQEPVRTLLRSMVQVRNRMFEGQGEASGVQTRQELGDPGDPEPPNPADQPGAGPHAGQDDGLLDATGETGSGGQGQGPASGESPGQGPGAKPDEQPVGPNQNDDASYGPGSQLQDGPQGPYEGDGPTYGPGPEEPPQGTGAPAGFQWLWQLFKKDSQSGSGTSGSGTSGSGTSGSGTSGSGTSGNGRSGGGRP